MNIDNTHLQFLRQRQSYMDLQFLKSPRYFLVINNAFVNNIIWLIFLIFRLLVYLMKVIQETRLGHYIQYLRFYLLDIVKDGIFTGKKIQRPI